MKQNLKMDNFYAFNNTEIHGTDIHGTLKYGYAYSYSNSEYVTYNQDLSPDKIIRMHNMVEIIDPKNLKIDSAVEDTEPMDIEEEVYEDPIFNTPEFQQEQNSGFDFVFSIILTLILFIIYVFCMLHVTSINQFNYQSYWAHCNGQGGPYMM